MILPEKKANLCHKVTIDEGGSDLIVAQQDYLRGVDQSIDSSRSTAEVAICEG